MPVEFISGSPAQIEWAVQIRLRVSEEFDRVARAFDAAPGGKTDFGRAVMAILEDKRSEVMGNTGAGYFIRNWQELSDQVRQLIAGDPRYPALQAAKKIQTEQDKS